jgi:hypothetical protein
MSFGGGERLTGLLSDPASRGILGASAGLLAAGAPRTDRPVSLGEAISSGLLSGAQAFDAATQRQADQAAAEELSALRKARMAALSKPDKISPLTDIAKINQDFQNGLITKETRDAQIAAALKQDEVLPLSTAGKLARDRRLGLLGPETQKVAETPEFEPADIDFRTAFGGDIAGVLTDVANIGAGAFGAAASEDRLRESAKLNNLNETLRGLLVKRSSKTGSVYSLKEVAKILPNSSTSNVKGVEMYRALLPELEKMLVEAQATLNSDDETTQTYKTQARRAVSELPGVIATIENSLSEFDGSRGRNPRGRNRNRGGTVDSSQGPIKFKRVDDGSN